MFLETNPKESHHFKRSREQNPIKQGQAREGNSGLRKSLLSEKGDPILSGFLIH